MIIPPKIKSVIIFMINSPSVTPLYFIKSEYFCELNYNINYYENVLSGIICRYSGKDCIFKLVIILLRNYNRAGLCYQAMQKRKGTESKKRRWINHRR